MDKERFKALCELYFFNTIQPDELKELKSALSSGDKDLQAIFARTKKSIDKLSLTIDISDQIADSNQNILLKTKSFRKKRLFPSYKRFHSDFPSIKFNIIVAISILLFISLLILTFYLYHLQNLESKLNSKIIKYSMQLDEDAKILSVLNFKQIEIINLEGQDINPTGFGKVFWSSFSSEAVLQISNLPPIDDSKVYRFWLVKDNQYLNKLVITPELFSTQNFYYIKDLPINNEDSSYTFILTLEPKIGTDKPNGTIYLKGTVN